MLVTEPSFSSDLSGFLHFRARAKSRIWLQFWTYSTVSISKQELSIDFWINVRRSLTEPHLSTSFFLPVFRIHPPGDWFQQSVQQTTVAVAYSGRSSKENSVGMCKMTYRMITFVFMGGGASECLKYGLNFSRLNLICKNLFNRGDQASFKAELDWVLSAQILFAVWNQQSEISRSHSVPIQLSRQVLFTWFLWKGDFCTDFVGNCYWSFVGDHGGTWFKAKEIIHKGKWHCLHFLQASSVVRCTSRDVVTNS